jgi:carbon-monoxide dehydrogenase medium subunit
MRRVKPPPFEYHRPGSLDEALAVLAEVGHDGKVLAGGQSLLPILSMRLAAPGHLVDVNRLTELDYVRADTGGVRVGALARHARVERDDPAADVQPLLRQALRLVAHPTIRNRGTSVGSLAHADPSGELTAVLALTAGRVTLATATGRREVDAADFFLGPLESAVRGGELALEAFFPAVPARTGTAFVEVSRRHGDYAMCGVAAMVTLDDDGRLVLARTAYLSMGPVPVVLDLTDAASPGGPDGWARASAAIAGRLEPEDDVHATAAYRGHLAAVLTRRALAQAAAVVTGEPDTPAAAPDAAAAPGGRTPGNRASGTRSRGTPRNGARTRTRSAPSGAPQQRRTPKKGETS